MTLTVPQVLNPVGAMLDSLAACLCAQVTLDGNEVCYCGVMAGDAVAIDYVDSCDSTCGMAWVRLVSALPSNSLGPPTGGAVAGNCLLGLLLDVEIGIARCYPLHEDGSPPDAAEQAAVVALQMADLLTMRTAVQCCSGSSDWLLGPYSPLGPQGGAIGGTWAVQMLVV